MRIYSEYIGMEFDKEKCTILIMRSGKQQMTKGMEILIKKKSERLEKRKLKKD